MKAIITAVVVAITLASVNTWALDDTPTNRSKEADRYFSKNPFQVGLQQAFDQMALTLPRSLREKFKKKIFRQVDMAVLERNMKHEMIKRFTADELKALADSDGYDIHEPLLKKFDAYMSAVMPIMEAKVSEAENNVLSEIMPEIIGEVLNDGRLGIRVKELYSSIAAKDWKAWYEMESTKMPFEMWKRDMGLDQPQHENVRKVVSGEMEKICSCVPWMNRDGRKTLRCTLFVRVTTEVEGHPEPVRVFEMWESVDGKWLHGITDHHQWDSCPK